MASELNGHPVHCQAQVQRVREDVPGQRAAEEAPGHARPGGQVIINNQSIIKLVNLINNPIK